MRDSDKFWGTPAKVRSCLNVVRYLVLSDLLVASKPITISEKQAEIKMNFFRIFPFSKKKGIDTLIIKSVARKTDLEASWRSPENKIRQMML